MVHSSDQQVQHKQKGALKAGTHQLMWQVWKYAMKYWKLLGFFIRDLGA